MRCGCLRWLVLRQPEALPQREVRHALVTPATIKARYQDFSTQTTEGFDDVAASLQKWSQRRDSTEVFQTLELPIRKHECGRARGARSSPVGLKAERAILIEPAVASDKSPVAL